MFTVSTAGSTAGNAGVCRASGPGRKIASAPATSATAAATANTAPDRERLPAAGALSTAEAEDDNVVRGCDGSGNGDDNAIVGFEPDRPRDRQARLARLAAENEHARGQRDRPAARIGRQALGQRRGHRLHRGRPRIRLLASMRATSASSAGSTPGATSCSRGGVEVRCAAIVGPTPRSENGGRPAAISNRMQPSA